MTILEAIEDNKKCDNIKLISYKTGQEMTVKRNGVWKVIVENLPNRKTILTTRIGNESCVIEYRDEP